MVTSMDELELNVCCLVNRRGTFLFIIEASGDDIEVNLRRILSTLRYIWLSAQPNLKVFILFEREIYIFNPFVTDDVERKLHGKLEMCKNDDCSYVTLRKFHSYPLKVEIFSSAYSVFEPPPDMDRQAATVNLAAYRGPDVKVAQFIQHQMNVTSEQSDNQSSKMKRI